MNSELYEEWIKSHQIEDDSVDLTDVVMSRITEKACKPNFLKQAWDSILLELMQAKVSVRACVLASGIVMGMIRMALQIYSALFT